MRTPTQDLQRLMETYENYCQKTSEPLSFFRWSWELLNTSVSNNQHEINESIRTKIMEENDNGIIDLICESFCDDVVE